MGIKPNGNGIIANIEVLEEDYIPEALQCRDAQRKELVYSLSPYKNRVRPEDCLCYGRPGTGKTSLVKYVLEQLGENTTAVVFYLNCWENKTLNLILDRMLEQAKIVLSEIGYSAKIDRLKQRVKEKFTVIALDEVDKLETKEMNDVIYILNNFGRTGLVLISNSRRYILRLDQRLMSRINLNQISFPPYSDKGVLSILRHRVDDCRALYPGSYSGDTLSKIAELSAGDARIAIQTLRKAALNAEKKSRSEISIDDIEKAFHDVKDIKKKYYLDKLSPHHKLIVNILRKNIELTSSEFYDIYRIDSRKQNLKTKSRRTFNNYLNDLIELNLV